jgi:hypothetical protein
MNVALSIRDPKSLLASCFILASALASSVAIAAAAAEVSAGPTATADAQEFSFESPWLRVAFSRTQPRMTYLSVDAVGTGRHQRNLLKAPLGAAPEFAGAQVETGTASPAGAATQVGNRIQYPPVKLADGTRASFAVTVEPKIIRLSIDREQSTNAAASSTWSMMFDATVTPVSPLGRTCPDPSMADHDSSAAPSPTDHAAPPRNVLTGPVLLHFPDWGSLLLRTRQDAGQDQPIWRYSLLRDLTLIAPGTVAHWRKMTPEERKKTQAIGNPYLLAWDHVHIGPEQIQISLQPPSVARPKPGKHHTELTMTVTSVYPKPELVDADPKLVGLKRAWLNIFGFRADLGCLANNSTGDLCQFVLYSYADQAFYTPPLFDDFTALDLVRTSLDHYFDGLKGYSDNFQDVAPSTIIAAWDYVVGKPDPGWLKRRIGRIEDYADRMLRMDRDGDGLCESPPGSSNWWDMFHYGGKDAYSSALAWRAFRCLADLEQRLGNSQKAAFYRERADKIQKVYYVTFYNPETGVLAGWRANDGQLKDKYFLWANGIAIAYGLVSPAQANAILDRLQAKMSEVGYTNFQYGLPGNLISAGKDFPLAQAVFPVYENGAATGSMAYFYVQALYATGRKQQADAIFDRMLKGYRDGTFQNGIGNGGDWKVWNGTPTGYEGMLVDAYYPLTAWITGRLGKGVPLPAGP